MKLLALIIFSAVLAKGCSKEKCEEHIKEDCICTFEYKPVCGCNGKTYGNACVAKCHGITDFTEGECE